MENIKHIHIDIKMPLTNMENKDNIYVKLKTKRKMNFLKK